VDGGCGGGVLGGGGWTYKQQVIGGEIYSQIKPEFPLAPIIIIILGHGNKKKF